MILELDQNLFHFINVKLSNPLFDSFFPWFTDIQKRPIFLYGLLPILLGWKIYKKDLFFFKALAVVALITLIGDNLNHFVLKPWIDRARPIAEILRIKAQGSPSFPSGHTTSAFLIAFGFSYFYPKQKYIFITLAALMGFSRIYCGVHYPGDVLGGIMYAALISFMMFKILKHPKINFLKFAVLLFFMIPQAHAWEWQDPTGGKGFFSWAWEDELKPTLKTAVDKNGLIILATGTASFTAVHQYDMTIYRDNKKHSPMFDRRTAEDITSLGDGGLGLAIAAGQILFDTENGVNHFKAIFLTSISHAGIAGLVQRKRPENQKDFLPFPSSFPSGHSSSAFATAGSLAYSYGWEVGIPAYTVATAIAYSRVRINKHWASDVVAGAFLGTYWARASFVDKKKPETEFSYIPAPIFDGLMLTAVKAF